MPPAAFEPPNPSNRTGADPRLRTRGHRDRVWLVLQILNSGTVHCNKDIHSTNTENDIDAECLISKSFAFTIILILSCPFKKYEFWIISNNILLCVIHARVSIVFQQRIYAKDTHCTHLFIPPSIIQYTVLCVFNNRRHIETFMSIQMWASPSIWIVLYSCIWEMPLPLE
jgi:hypothetical protein